MKKFFKVVDKLSEILADCSGIIIFVMMLFMTLDVVLRYVFNSPVRGDYELIELAMVVLVFFAIPHTQTVKGHVAVDIITNFMPRKIRDILEIVSYLIASVLMFFVCRANYLQIFKVQGNGQTTGTLHIACYPFYAIVFVCLCIYMLIMVVDVIRALMDLFSSNKKEEES